MGRVAWLTGLLFFVAPLTAADKGTVVDVDGPVRQPIERLAQDLHGLTHLLDAHEIAPVAVAEVGGRDVGSGDVALGNSSTLEDPLVSGLHHLFQLEIRQHTRRRVTSQRGNLGFWQCPSQVSMKKPDSP